MQLWDTGVNKNARFKNTLFINIGGTEDHFILEEFVTYLINLLLLQEKIEFNCVFWTTDF